jgi:prepilin-type N-terminal cleavage/methylation domain-containing protein
MKQKRGFTLLELLIVISIMVAMMGLLLPAIAKMRKKGKAQLNDIQQRAIVSAVHAYRLRYHKWPADYSALNVNDLVDATYGAGADGNNGIFDELEVPPNGDESLIDMNDFSRRDDNDNVLNPYGDAFQITLDLDEDFTPTGGVSVE